MRNRNEVEEIRNAAGITGASFATAAEEYASFIVAWINDDKLNGMNNAFKSTEAANSMMKDYLPIRIIKMW